MTKIEPEAMRKRIAELEAQLATLQDSAHLRWVQRMEGVPREDRERVKREIEEAFGGLSEDHPVWVALNKLLAIQLHVEHLAAREPVISNDLRNLRVGRESGLEDFRAACWQIFGRVRK